MGSFMLHPPMARSTFRPGFFCFRAAACGTSVFLEVSSTISGLKAASRKAKLYSTCVQCAGLSFEGVQLQLPGRHCKGQVQGRAAGRGMAGGTCAGRQPLS